MALSLTDSFERRDAILAGLTRRNRVVAVLRLAIPALGLLVFVVLLGQIYLSNLARQYGVSGIRVDRGNVVVDTPQYAATSRDGVRYSIAAREARSPLGDGKKIAMTDARLEMARPGQAVIHASAAAMDADTGAQRVVVPGAMVFSSEDGLAGTVHALDANLDQSIAVASGAVDMVFPDGAHLTADSMRYDGVAQTMSFVRATLTLNDLPGAAQ